MKKTLSHSIAPALMALALLAAPAWAQDPAPSSTAVSAAEKHAQKHEDFVEERIMDLHNQLQITDAQSKQWGNFAQTMRENAHRTDDAMKDYAEKSGNLSAVEVMKSYATMAQVHADNMQKLVSALNDLYGSLSDDQKKTADTLFRSRHQMGPAHGHEAEGCGGGGSYHHHHRHHHHHHHHKSAPASSASSAPPG